MKYSDPIHILEAYESKKLDKTSSVNELIEYIKNEDFDLQKIAVLRKISNSKYKKNEVIFLMLKNLLLSNKNEIVRANAAKLIILNHLIDGGEIIKKAIDNDYSYRCNRVIYYSLKSNSTDLSMKLYSYLKQFLAEKFSKIYDVLPEEGMALGLLELEYKDVYHKKVGASGEFLISFNTKNNHVVEIICHGIGPNLELLRFFSELKKLKIIYSHMDSLNGLEHLRSLEHLELDSIGMIKSSKIPELEYLVNLKSLKITRLGLTEIKHIEYLTNLEILYYNGGESYDFRGSIKEIKGLKRLLKLKSLTICNHQISEIKGLETLKNLEKLNLSYNLIEDVSGLDSLINLRELYLDLNNINEIKNINRFTELQILDVDGNPLSELPGIENLKNLIHLSISKTNISDETRLKYENLIKTNQERLKEKKRNLVQYAEELHQRGEFNKAIELFEKIKQINQSFHTYRLRSFDYLSNEEWFSLARIYFSKMDYEKALYACEQGIKVDSRPEPIRKLKKRVINLLKNKG